jgi:hypothetical protein
MDRERRGEERACEKRIMDFCLLAVLIFLEH